jgi:hypothetical protein
LLLLLIPLSTALGLWWLDHAQSIDRILSYIRQTLWSKIIEWPLAGGEPGSYEDVVPSTSMLGRATLTGSFFFVFIVPSVASVVDSFRALDHASSWVFWSVDVVVLVFLLTLWMFYLSGRPKNGAGMA